MREFDFIARIARRLQAKRRDTQLSIGDDAAVLAPADREIAITTDTLIAGRHFPEDTSAFDIGYKAIAVNLSDLAAMGADPAWLTIALSAPELDAEWADAFIDGALAATGGFDVDIVGGDTTRGALSVTITALGTLIPGTALTRAGAQTGDLIAVTGTLGDAALGLMRWPQRGQTDDPHSQYLLDRLCRPQWRAAKRLSGLVHAAIDVSDGVAADLGHILKASDMGAHIDVDSLPVSTAFQHHVSDIEQRRRLQLTGGDDYELCLVLPRSALPAVRLLLDCPLTVVGAIEAEAGLRLVDAEAEPVALGDAAGWDHFL